MISPRSVSVAVPAGDVSPRETPSLYTPQQVADLVGMSRFAVMFWIRTGRLPAIKLMGRWRVYRADVLAMIYRARKA